MTRQQPSRRGVNPSRDPDLAAEGDASTPPLRWPARATGPRLIAGLLMALQAVLVAAFAGWFVVETAQGQSEDTARGVTAAILIAIFAVGLSIIARAWFTGAGWPRTPTLLWNALLIPVAMTLWQSDRQAVSSGLLMLVLATIAAAILSGPEVRDESQSRA